METKTESQKENFNSSYQNHDIENVLDLKVIKEAKDVIKELKEVSKLISQLRIQIEVLGQCCQVKSQKNMDIKD